MTEVFDGLRACPTALLASYHELQVSNNATLMMTLRTHSNRTMSNLLLPIRFSSTKSSLAATPIRYLSTEALAEQRQPAQLARLPVPDLHKTLQGYVQSLVPFLREQEVRGGTPFEVALNERLRWAATFEAGVGADCQRRLSGKHAHSGLRSRY